MAVSRTIHPKAPSQKPVDFVMGKQQGGAQGRPEKVAERQSNPGMREKMSRKGL